MLERMSRWRRAGRASRGLALSLIRIAGSVRDAGIHGAGGELALFRHFPVGGIPGLVY